MSLRVDPFEGARVTLFHMFDIQFLQVIFPVGIHHFVECHVYLFIIALPLFSPEIVVTTSTLQDISYGPESVVSE